MDNDLPVMLMTSNTEGEVRRFIESTNWIEDRAYTQNNFLSPNLSTLALSTLKTTNPWVIQIKLCQILWKNSTESFCRQAAVTFWRNSSNCCYGCNKIVVCMALIGGGNQVPVPFSLCTALFRWSHYLRLTQHPSKYLCTTVWDENFTSYTWPMKLTLVYAVAWKHQIYVFLR